MLRSFTVNQGKLDDLSRSGGEYRVYLAVDRAANTDINHASFSDARSQRVFCILQLAGAGGGKFRCG